MSTERYEIKGKIGEGGVGAVYHAYDTHLNRDVAIKRVLANGGYEDQEEATKSLLKEATALSSVQHPHIVTVYDAGIDSDGPYVVMELIHGRTLDEMVERATMTWDDLREVALQCQEALIAAQDLDLVHRDLKPSNIMVCWLPSGKFQVKIVDFGLAKFSATPSLQTIAHGDAVFGSIFFMAPEQFERAPLDKSTDMYSMGCLYYYALTGEYPFNGETAAMVMASHLQHHVTPLHELRPDIPKWGADWIMWHIERDMKQRPQDARESLGRFLLLDQQSTQPVTVSADNPAGLVIPQSNAPQAGAPQFNFPNQQTTSQVNPLTAQQAITPPNPAMNVHTGAQPVIAQPQLATAPQFAQPVQPATAPQFAQPVQPATAPQFAQPVQPATAPQFAHPGTGTQPIQPATAPQFAQPGTATQQVQPGITQGMPPQGEITEQADVKPPKQGLPPAVKWTVIGLLALVIAVTAWIIIDQSGARKEAKFYKETMAETKKLFDSGKLKDGYKIDREHLDAVLHQASKINYKPGSLQDEKGRALQRATLAYAKGDGFDADEVISEYITKTEMPSYLRAKLFETVFPRRNNVKNADPLLTFAEKTEGNKDKVVELALLAAYRSLKGHTLDESDAKEYFDRFLNFIQNTNDTGIRRYAVKGAFEIISQSENKNRFAKQIIHTYELTTEKQPKYALLRLMAAAGGEDATKIVNKALNSSDYALKNAALAALGKWADDSQFKTLIKFISETGANTSIGKTAFEEAIKFLKIKRDRDPADTGDMWRDLSELAQTQIQKMSIIKGMRANPYNWAIPILDKLIHDKDDLIIDKAEQAKEEIQEKLKNK